MKTMVEKGLKVKDIMKGKMIADSMLSTMFPKLHDVKATNRAVQSMIHVMTTYPPVTRLVSCFMNKIKKDPSYLSQCSAFQKRILLFIVVECLMTGGDIDFRFTSENLTPLETALVRLSDIALAFENEIVQSDFCEVWHQTVKQTIIMFLKNNQPLEASKILVLYRDRIREEPKELLEKLISYSSDRKEYIQSLADLEGHDFSSYYYAMADFLRGLNSKLEETTLHKFASKISLSVTHENGDGNTNVDDSESEDTNQLDVDAEVDPLEDIIATRESSRETIFAEEKRKARSRSTIISDEDISSLSDFQNEQEEIDKTKSPTKARGIDEDQKSSKTTSTTNIDIENMDPKIGLTYRLKKQIHSSGIIIPCKHIVKHCRKIHNEIEENKEIRSQKSPAQTKQKKFVPVTSAALLKSPYKPSMPPRNLLLGERFEDMNSSFHSSTSGRLYSNRKRIPFTIDLDSYIVAGCKQFGVGHWSKILNAFPFPTGCTNVKIKDRFRNLLRLQHIAILDDGDFNVLNLELKSKLPAAEAKMDKSKKNLKRGYTGSSNQSISTAGWSDGTSKRSERLKASTKIPPKQKLDDKNNKKKQMLTSPRKRLEVVSMDSAEENATSSSTRRIPTSSTPYKIKFTSKEDAYLLCGARHLGMRWNVLKEFFDFNPKISTMDMQNRWDALIDNGQISINEEDDEIICLDEKLQERCQNVTNELKQRIQSQRRKFSDDVSDSEQESEVDESSVAGGKQKNQRLNCSSIENCESEEEILDDETHFAQPVPIKVKPSKKKKVKPALNTSIDAGTQTKRAKFTLRKQSPSLLEASSSSNTSNNSSRSSKSSSLELKRRKHKKPLPMGSPIRPSMINHFKQSKKLLTDSLSGSPTKRKKRDRRDSYAKDLRERRRREISRMQRQNNGNAKKNPWRDEEVKQLLSGLEKYGPGKWSLILDEGYEIFNNRTSVMLKDKFRNMLRHDAIPEDLVLLWNARKAAKE